MTAMHMSAPAKINLHLEVLGRREDGFHVLETVFQALDLCDGVTVECVPATPGEPTIRLSCSAPDVPSDERNLAWKAAATMLERRPALGCVRLRLDKRIPHGAGLGGGSSDAAAVLRALQRLADPPLPPGELAALALGLGSDVPFFLLGGTAHALGRGELLSPLPDLPPQAVTVLKPAAGLATPRVFQALSDAERGPRSARGADWWREALAADGWTSHLHNRLAAAASRLEPAVADLLAHLRRSGVPHLLSGSGSACFALGEVAPPPGVDCWRTRFRARGDLERG